MFTLTWTVIHEIDKTSPLYGIDWGAPEKLFKGVIVTVMGHDGTYGQTIYARHLYYPEHLRTGESFADIMNELEDGRIMIDYTKFHDTLPDEDNSAATKTAQLEARNSSPE